MPIVLEEPIIKNYNIVWIKNLAIDASNPSDGGDIKLNATFGFVAKNGPVGEFLPNNEIIMSIADINGEMTNDPQLAQLFQAVVGKLIFMAKARGLLPNIAVQ